MAIQTIVTRQGIPATVVAEPVSTRLRIFLVVCVAALAAAGTAVGVTLATRQDPPQPRAIEGKPPLGPELPTPAAAEIRKTFGAWPEGGIETMERLGREYPRDAVVQLYRGIALLWAGYPNEGEAALRRAKRVGRDTPWEIQADTVLHPDYIAGYPTFRPLGADPLLERGSQLQAEGKQHSAGRVFDRAARLRPDDDQAQVAAAVARFDKDNPTPAFSRLGPLTRKFPESQVVRYYLGLLLAWTKQPEAVEQFEKTVALGPDTELGRVAAQLLSGGVEGGTVPSGK
jgi:hypothetical protein